ncbi:Cytochrome P450 [Rhypophila decipiens]
MRWWALDYIFLPAEYLPDLKRAVAHRLSFFENISFAFSLDASVGDLYSSNLMANVVTRGINPRLGTDSSSSPPAPHIFLLDQTNAMYDLANLVPLLQSEADYALAKEIAYHLTRDGEWASFSTSGLLVNMMHRMASRVLIGPELCRDETCLTVTQALNNSIFINGLAISMVPPFPSPVRDLLKGMLSLLHRRVLSRAVNAIPPVVQKRFSEFQNPVARKMHLAGPENRSMMQSIQWTLALTTSTHTKEHNPHRVAVSLLHNLWAGSAAPAGTVTQMVFQVLLEPKYLPPLRDEATSSLALHGGYTEKALNNMPLPDSFIRDINRLYATGAVTCARTVIDPDGYQFSDGLSLPPGTRIAVYAASTVSETYLPFGIGRHSCPGRFLAIRMIKLLFLKLILEYDIKWDREVGSKRPANLSLNGQFAPNQRQKIWLRRRI